MSAQTSQGRFLLSTAAFVIVIAGMREARDLLLPLLLSGFIAIIAAPALFALKKWRIPTGIAILLIISIIAVLGSLVGNLVGSSLDDFTAQLPFYQQQLNAQKSTLMKQVASWGLNLPEATLQNILDPAKAMKMAAQGLTSLGGLLTNTFLILLTVIFILFEASSFPKKIHLISKNKDLSYLHLQRIGDDIKRYMAIKTMTSLLTGVLASLLLWVIGVDYPLLWGLLAFFLNFVPNIGSIIAAVPPLLLALVQLGSAGAIPVAIGYIVINNLIGNVIEPKFMGKGLGLSSLVVFLSMVFWGWVLGTVGMFLSVPLTMTLKIILDAQDHTRWIAILLGPDLAATSTEKKSPLISRLPSLALFKKDRE